MHKQKSAELKQILEKHVETLTPSEEIFLLVAVIYRYRNNIFHGNKGVSSWLQFHKEIDWCTKIMQELIDISETASDKARNFIAERHRPATLSHGG